MKKVLVTMATAGLLAAIALPAGAEEQVVDATLESSVSMTTSPTATVSGWALSPSATNTASGGTMTISANSSYSVTVTPDVNAMSEHDGTGYVTSGKTLSAALNIIASYTGGTAPVPGLGATAITGTSTALATGTGGGTDDYDITLSQATTVADEALPTGRTYHIELTYTASSTL